MNCPVCRLENLPGTESCDCGYSFATRKVDSSSGDIRRIADAVESIRKMMRFWIIASIVAGVAGAFFFNSEFTRFDERLQKLKTEMPAATR